MTIRPCIRLIAMHASLVATRVRPTNMAMRLACTRLMSMAMRLACTKKHLTYTNSSYVQKRMSYIYEKCSYIHDYKNPCSRVHKCPPPLSLTFFNQLVRKQNPLIVWFRYCVCVLCDMSIPTTLKKPNTLQCWNLHKDSRKITHRLSFHHAAQELSPKTVILFYVNALPDS